MAIKEGYKAVTVQLDEQIVVWLEGRAAANFRSLAGQVRAIIETAKKGKIKNTEGVCK